jgi:6-phosphogluconate dehydrogenase
MSAVERQRDVFGAHGYHRVGRDGDGRGTPAVAWRVKELRWAHRRGKY